VPPCRPPPFPLGFTAMTDHSRVGEVRPGCGPQSGMAPVRFQSVSSPGPCRVREVADSQSGPFSCCF
jgi:hypothetical protein